MSDQQSKISIKAIKQLKLKDLIAELQPSEIPGMNVVNELTNECSNFLNERIFIFEVSYKGQQWEIRRTLKQFQQLEYDISLYAIYYYFKSKMIPKTFVSENSEETLILLLNFLQVTLTSGILPQSFLTFLEISSIRLPLKRKECFLLKKKSRKTDQSYWQSFKNVFQSWKKRYFIIVQNGVYYTDGPEKTEDDVKECLSFDSRCQVFFRKKDTGEENKIVMQFAQQRIEVKAESKVVFIDFVFTLFQTIGKSPYTKKQRFDSFSPLRYSFCQWYVDGKDYYSDVCDAILEAKETIQITDWWLSPELYLKRPVNLQDPLSQNKNNQTRLDQLLKQVADKGVMVLILIYNAHPVALKLNSQHTEEALTNLSKNIKVVRHPGQVTPKFFSHHEKMVLIDSSIAFMGGLDLCFGRWDTHDHLLFEVSQNETLWPQIDFSNSRIKDFIDVEKYEQSLLTENQPRMPWHDIAIQIRGDTVVDIARHFTQYWNHASIDNYQLVLHSPDVKFKEIPNQPLVCCSAQKQQKTTKNDLYLLKELEIQEEEDKDIIDNELEIEQQYNQTIDNLVSTFQIYLDYQQQKKQKQEQEIYKVYRPYNKNIEIGQFDIKKACVTQLTRSSSSWSSGVSNTEFSIQNAYLKLIEHSQHFIYIENQFFISSTAGKQVFNQVAEKLIERIVRAHQNKQRFKVIVFIPLLPGFEGEIDDDKAAVLKVQLYWEYQTINRGKSSILQVLNSKGIKNPFEYIEFFSLRQHSQYPNPVTEIIYIHSKLMIVDDKVALIGSANINDRSLNGSRDSELAIIVQDQIKIETQMNGQPFQSAKFAHTLRCQLYMEHFGLNENQVQDPLSIDLENEIRKRTTLNTQIYREIFACYPDDTVTSVKEYKAFAKKKNLQKYKELIPQIQGHAVQFPLNFLSTEKLSPKIYNAEYFLPARVFT